MIVTLCIAKIKNAHCRIGIAWTDIGSPAELLGKNRITERRSGPVKVGMLFRMSI